MSRIRNLKGGIFYRPVDAAAGKAGWCAELFWEEFTPRKRSKGTKDRSHAMRTNWTPHEQRYGPCKTESEVAAQYNPERQRLNELLNKPADQK